MKATSEDPRTDKMKRVMSTHFAEWEADYRDADWGEVVYEDAEVVVMADHKGYEWSEWSSGYDAQQFSEAMHTLARQVCDYDWSVSYPLVFDKLE